MTTVIKVNDKFVSITKGAPDRVINLSVNNQDVLDKANKANSEMATNALRVLALGIKEFDYLPKVEELEKELNELQYNNLLTTNQNGNSTLMSMQNAVDKLEDVYNTNLALYELGAVSQKDLENSKKALDEAKLPANVYEKAKNELQKYASTNNQMAESGVIRSYLDWIINLPWYKASEDNNDLADVAKNLDKNQENT